MKKNTIIIIILLVSFYGNSQNFKRLDSLSEKFIRDYQIPGIGIVGVENGKITYLKAFGKANEKSDFSDSTQIYIASNTKAFTGLAIKKLSNSGKLSYEDSITKFIPREFFHENIEANKIYIKDLLQHTHGVSNDPLVFRTAYSGEHPEDLQELLKFTVYANDTLIKNYKYSNLGYLLCGIIIEEITQQSWQDYLKDEILKQLNMTKTYAYINFERKLEALPYDYNKPAPILKSQKSINTLHAAGGLYSNLSDMAKWLLKLTGGEGILEDVTKDDYLNDFTEVNQKDGPINIKTYGNGWIYGDLLAKKNLYYHFGRFKGYESVISFDPVQKKGVYVFINERIGGVYAASVLNTYFYFLSDEDNNNANESIKPVLSLINGVYDKSNRELRRKFLGDTSISLAGSYYSPKYGNLYVDKTSDGVIFKLGKLESYAFQGEDNNEILIEWTPGIIEHFYLNNDSDRVKLIYGEFGEFLKK